MVSASVLHNVEKKHILKHETWLNPSAVISFATTVQPGEHIAAEFFISRMLPCETGGLWPMSYICNPIPVSSKKLRLSFNKIECFACELWFGINTISIRKGIKEKHETTQSPCTCCIFQLICPINSLDTQCSAGPHRLKFIYGGKSIEERHISICCLTPLRESHLCTYLSCGQPLDRASIGLCGLKS